MASILEYGRMAMELLRDLGTQMLSSARIAQALGVDSTATDRGELIRASRTARQLRNEGRSFSIGMDEDGRIHFAATRPEPQQMTNEQIAAELDINATGISRGELISALASAREVSAAGRIPEVTIGASAHRPGQEVSRTICVESGAEVGIILDQARKYAGRSNEELAQALGVDASHISRRELVSALEAVRTCEKLGVEPEVTSEGEHISITGTSNSSTRLEMPDGRSVVIRARFASAAVSSPPKEDSVPGEWANRVAGTRTGRVLE